MLSKKLFGGAALSALSLIGAAHAQETTSALRGEVTSDAGAPIAGAQVTIVHEPTGTRTVTTTNNAGIFDARGLRTGGPFFVEFEANAFVGERLEGLFLVPGDPIRLNVDLTEATAQVDDIVVRAQRPAFVGTVGSNTTLTRRDVEGVVSVNRDIRDLARRSPLVSQTAGPNQGIRIAGSNPRTNRITIDGVQAQDDFGLNTGGLPTRRGPVSLDAIESFQVEAVPFDVENGDFLGGAINVVLAQGTNEFDGSAFVNYLNEGLVGTRLGGQASPRITTQENYGGTLRGPILKDTLFFALSYEYYNSADVTDRGPRGLGFPNSINGPSGTLTQANIDEVVSIFRTDYSGTRNTGGIPLTAPIFDEKYTGRFDWNINDQHRAFATYRYSESGIIQRTNLSQTSAGLSSQWYLTGEEDQTFAFQLNSDWTSNFSTEARFSQRNYVRQQAPPGGQTFSDVIVCTAPTPVADSRTCENLDGSTGGVVRFGPDQFRHANFLETETQTANLSGEYAIGRHSVKAGVQWQRTDVFNLFVPDSDGRYYFDSVADFRAGRANQFNYRNALTNNANDAAAAFEYHIWSGFVQDTWDITSDITLTAGLRYDYYAADDKPVLNAPFRTRYGFSNLETYNGRDVIMPRFALEWRATDDLTLSGGVGLFSGGLPDVFISNSFSNTGALDNQFEFRRAGNGAITENNGNLNCAGADAAVCQAALNVPVNSSFGAQVPQLVRDALGRLSASPFAETNSLDPGFEIPSDWRANFALEYSKWDYDFGFDVVYVRTNEGLAFRDLRAVPLLINGTQARTPDGRLRYDGLTTAQRTAGVNALNAASGTTTNTISSPATIAPRIPLASNGSIGGNRDIQAFNPDEESEYLTVAFSVGREYDFGLDWRVSYTLQNFDEFSNAARFASTASSLYGDQYTRLDPNLPERGQGLEEIEDTFKAEVGFSKNFFGDLETRFQLFGEYATDRASTPVMGTVGGGRSTTFGVNRANQLAYLPNLTGTATRRDDVDVGLSTTPGAGTITISSDPRVVFDAPSRGSANPVSGERPIIDPNLQIATVQRLLQQLGLSGGRIAERGDIENDDIARFDLVISQELPAFRKTHRTLLTFELQNVGNLINDDWGLIRTRSESIRLFDVTCAGADGIADNDGQATCQTYRISNANTTGQNETLDSETSRWYMQIGLKYQF